MRIWIRLCARLYPARWRQRYGTEFDTLLEDTAPSLRNAIDIGWGALEMHMRIWTFPKLAVVCGLLGAILAAAIAVRIPHQYVSEALLIVSGDVPGLQGFRDRVLERALSEASIRELIRKNDLYAADRRRIPIEDAVLRMRRDIAVTVRKEAPADGNNYLVSVRFVSRDPSEGQRTASDLVAKVVDANLVANHPGAIVEVLRPAALPREPIGPNHLVITLLGAATGLALAALASLAIRLRRRASQT